MRTRLFLFILLLAGLPMLRAASNDLHTQASPAAAGEIKITEFMASNTGALRDEDGDSPDWIEIFNGTAAPINLANWSLTDNANNLRKWVFPATTLASNSYLIVFASGKDRADAGSELHANFSLSADGEYLGLVDAATNVISSFAPVYPPQVANVSYGVAKLAPPQSFITNGSLLRYIVPTDDSLGTNWIFPGFNDSTWGTGANAVGYETAAADYAGLYRTDVRALMFNRSPSCLIRIPFVVSDPTSLTDWILRLQADDGVVIWLNGEEVLRYLVPDTVLWNTFALTNRVDSDVLPGVTFDLAEFENLIVAGTNVFAIHALNARLDSSDLLINPLLDAKSTVQVEASQRYFTLPTPGEPNVGGIEVLGPVVTDLQHAPRIPSDGQDLTVSARVVPAFGPVTNVILHYRVMFSNEVAVAMFDDGTHNDGLAGDGVFAALIPSNASNPGQMVRYYVTAADNAGRTGRAPLFLDPLGAPEYQGTIVPDLSVNTPLPVFHWFVQNPAAAETATGTRSALFYDGEFYDNIFVRLRGGTSRSWPKRSFKVEFNEGFHFLLRESLPSVSEFDWNTTYTDKSYNRKVLAYEGYRDAGQPVIETFHAHLRQNGAFFSVTLWTEQPDRDFLRRWGLDPDGALYKAGFNGGAGANYESVGAFEKKTRREEGTADLQALITGLALPGVALENFIFDNVDIPGMVNVTAIVCIQQNIDASDKNHYLYRDTQGSREWRFLPWDLDLTYGPNALNTDVMVYNEQDITIPRATSHPFIGARPYLLSAGKYNRFIEAIVNVPRTREMLLRRIRTLVEEQILSGYTQRRIDELVTILGPDIAADRARWGAAAHFGTVVYSFQAANDRIKNEYLIPRADYLTSHSIVNVGAANPGPEPLFVNVRISQVEANPASGNQKQEYVCITNSNPFAADLTGWHLRGDVEFAFKPGTVLPAHSVIYLSPDVVAFRARSSNPRGGSGLFVQGNYLGNLSARGGTLRLIDRWGREAHAVDVSGMPSPAQQYLRITELMYHPSALSGNTNSSEEFEFIELMNISATETLSLNGVRLVDGVQFDFTGSAVTTLAPGAAVLVVKNSAAFSARYGLGFSIAGQYVGRFNNTGQRIRLVDATGEEILDFVYNQDWYPITDGLGFSLSVVNPSAPVASWNEKSHWRSTTHRGGSPGTTDPTPLFIAPILVNEALTRTDTPPPVDGIELFNPTSTNVNIGGWYLTDDFNTPFKFRIPNDTIISPHGYFVVSEAEFNPGGAGFALGSDGDEVWLFAADATPNLLGYAHGFAFGAADDGVSFGRHTTSLGEEHFVAQINASMNGPNSAPRTGPLVISEIMLHPLGVGTNDNTEDEFVELVNVSGATVPLYDPAQPAHTWRLTGGVDFVFPTNRALVPGEYAIVVSFDPAAEPNQAQVFRTKFGLNANVQLFGPYSGRLSNAEDDVILLKPTTAVDDAVPLVVVDQVSYRDELPWPGGDGDGTSLQRKNNLAYGNDPANWAAAAPSAAGAYGTGATPTIIGQPASQTVAAFQAASFMVNATGVGPLRYQWRRSGSNIGGATNQTLTITNVQPSHYGTYSVVVFNAAGSAVSSSALLNINVPPTITSQPQSRTVLAGASVTFTVGAAGTGNLTYQWRYNGNDIVGATTPSFTLSNLAASQSGIFTVIVRDDIALRESNPAILTVLDTPFISVQPNPGYQEVLPGSTFTIEVTATGSAPLVYRWRRNNITVLNQTNALLRITNAASGNAGNYTVTVTNAAGVATGTVAVVVFRPDNDRDGIADPWEQLHGFNTNNAADALLDFDGDHSSNLAEYISGTDPANAASYLRVDNLSINGGAATLQFFAVSNRTYSILSKTSLDSGTWTRLFDLPARATNRVEIVFDPNLSTNRFYRLVTPKPTP